MAKSKLTENIYYFHSLRVFILIFYIATLAIHLLVIATIIPYQWVNGGMSPTYEAQAVQSAVSIVITGLLLFMVRGLVKRLREPKVWQIRALYVLTGLLVLGFIQQLLGTPFERYAVSIVLIIGVVGHMMLIKQLSKLRK